MASRPSRRTCTSTRRLSHSRHAKNHSATGGGLGVGVVSGHTGCAPCAVIPVSQVCAILVVMFVSPLRGCLRCRVLTFQGVCAALVCLSLCHCCALVAGIVP